MSYRQADVASLRTLRKARDRIDRDYREEIGIEALAREAGYPSGPPDAISHIPNIFGRWIMSR
jgi:hypothetical protein